jgi:2-keto-4-pentenoate hydratase/2-oxohepta-3-ene-1,7-dioic acid hydratase in catechol pathway
VFLKAPNTIVGPTDPVRIPRRSTKTDYEVELGVVIGRTARYLDSPDDAALVIAGTRCRTMSPSESSSSSVAACGIRASRVRPSTARSVAGDPDEIADPQALRLRLWVNGGLCQDSTTGNMIFGVAHVIGT